MSSKTNIIEYTIKMVILQGAFSIVHVLNIETAISKSFLNFMSGMQCSYFYVAMYFALMSSPWSMNQ